MAKKRCKMAKEEYHIKNSAKFAKIVENPKFVCKKCARVACKEDRLCKPCGLDK